MRSDRLNRMTKDEAERLSIEALSFLAGRPEELGRFFALSGLDPRSLREAALDSGFLGGVLDFLLGGEELLLVFSEEKGLDPATISLARQCLAGNPDR